MTILYLFCITAVRERVVTRSRNGVHHLRFPFVLIKPPNAIFPEVIYYIVYSLRPLK